MALQNTLVLIPFISGLDCYTMRLLPRRWLGLNPFYFRAGLLPEAYERNLYRFGS